MIYHLYRQTVELSEKLTLISAAIDRAQKDTTTLADVCNIFIDLIEESKLSSHCGMVILRFKQVTLTFHFVAYMLYPEFRGQPEWLEVASEWLLSKDIEFVNIAIVF